VTIRNSILICILLTCFGCTYNAKKSETSYNESRELIPNPEGYKKDSFKQVNYDSVIQYVVFGVYCGECGGHCATMYRCNLIGNAATLFVDSTDSYFKKHGDIECNTEVDDLKKLNLAMSVVAQIPAQILTAEKLSERFGCPDCTDGCGIYFEFKQGLKVKKFYIIFKNNYWAIKQTLNNPL
jgi:hypothetical protein